MNPTDKMEMQVEESQDGSAIVALPEGEENPQAQVAAADNNQDDFDDDNDDALDRQDAQSSDSDQGNMTIEELRNTRREERRLRRKIHKQKNNHLVDALKKQNADLSNRLAAVEKKTSGAELARVDKAIEDAGVQVEYAKMKMKEAVSISDGEGLAKAQELWYESKRKMESLETLKQNAAKHMSQPNQNIQIPDPMVQRLAADWMDDNPWYDPNGRNEESQIAQMIDKRLTEEGFDPTTEDYWDELDSRMRRYMPKQQNNQKAARPRSVMTSSGRDSTATTKSNEFRLSPDRVAAIKEAGLWDNPQARQNAIRKYAEWDRTNKNRG
jgi:hypothetical protein